MVVNDIVVAGGGLSGLLTARYINEMVPSADVRVYERRTKDRYRVDCGEGFIDLRGVLGRVSEEVRSFIRSEIETSLWRFKTGNEVREVSVEHDDFFWVIDRVGWQKKILSDIEDSVDVFFDNEVEIEDIDCDLVVDARGPRYKVGSAIYGIYEGDFSGISGRAIFDYREGMDGYYWVFPQGDNYANIGYGEFGEEIGESELKRYVEDLPIEIESKISAGGGYFDYTYYLKDFHGKKTQLIKKRDDGSWLARVGDAAGIINPMTGEGISGAVSTSYQLARAIKKDAFDKYPVWVEKENKHKINVKMAKLRKKNFNKFVDKFSKLDGVKASHCNSVIGFLLRHPIKSIKFLMV